MATGLLALLDDIATILDDVAVMTKMAAKKTAGILGDDLALNAEQVSGVKADRELPVVWAVAKGSFFNKLILVPSALLISAFIPWLITPLLMLGGAYLCFEGAEKIVHKFIHKKENKNYNQQLINESTVLLQFEKNKIAGAIRTDFILSAEIIVISLGVVQGMTIVTQTTVVSIIAIAMTVGVYGLVAGIIKIDDLGFWIYRNSKDRTFKRTLGEKLIRSTPYLMRFLSIVGTIAMFLVGGGILVHGIPAIASGFENLTASLSQIPTIGDLLASLSQSLLNGLFGLIIGAILVPVIDRAEKIFGKKPT